TPDPIQLGGGDLVFLPKGSPHAIKDAQATPERAVEQALGSCDRARETSPAGIVRYGGGGAATTLVAGYFSTEKGAPNLLFDSLPPVVHVKGDAGTTVRWLEANLQFIGSEMASGEPGFETIVSRLADILVVQAVRAHVAQTSGGGKGGVASMCVFGRGFRPPRREPAPDFPDARGDAEGEPPAGDEPGRRRRDREA